MNERLDKLAIQVTDNYNKLRKICKETGDLKLVLDASLNIYEEKLNKFEKIKRKIEQNWKRYGKITTNFVKI